MQGTDPFLPPAASGGDSENAAPAGQERRGEPSRRRPPAPRPPSPGPRSGGPSAPATRVAPLPCREGPASPSRPAAQSQETPGGAVPLLLATPDLREGSAPRRGTISLPTWQLPGKPQFETRPFSTT